MQSNNLQMFKIKNNNGNKLKYTRNTYLHIDSTENYMLGIFYSFSHYNIKSDKTIFKRSI